MQIKRCPKGEERLITKDLGRNEDGDKITALIETCKKRGGWQIKPNVHITGGFRLIILHGVYLEHTERFASLLAAREEAQKFIPEPKESLTLAV